MSRNQLANPRAVHLPLAPHAGEPIIEPDLPIIDPHHHLRDRTGDHYMFEDVLHDMSSGHRVIATVAIECGDMYRDFGPEHLRPVGETEVAAGVAAMFDSGKYGRRAGVAGIVASADLSLGGAQLQEVFDAHRLAAGGRFCGIRVPVAWGEDPEFRKTRTGARGMMLDPAFQEGVRSVGRNGLAYDAWVYHPQLGELTALARACPDTRIIVNHVGGPLGVGPYAGRHAEVFPIWRAALQTLASCPNVYCKVGGLGMPIIGLGFDQPGVPRPSSEQLAPLWRPYIDTTIELFGAARCMFESNYPPDHLSCDYDVLWNTFKRVVQGASAAEKAALFCETAGEVYQLRPHLAARGLL